MTIQFDVNDEVFAWLQRKAAELNLTSVEAVVRQLLDEALASEDADFERITHQLLAKNAELYRRLAASNS